MKKRLVYLIFILYAFLPYYSEASFEGTRFIDYQSPTFATYKWKASNINLLGNVIILPKDPFDEKEAIEIIERIGQLNPWYLKKMEEENIRIKLFSGKLTEQPKAAHLKGRVPKGYITKTWDDVPGMATSKVAFIKIGSSEKGNGHGSHNLELHEVGHLLDPVVFNNPLNEIVFKNIWRHEAPVLFPNTKYFINDHEEYYAEAFAMFYLNKQTKADLLNKAPKTYSFLQQLELSMEAKMPGILLGVNEITFHP